MFFWICAFVIPLLWLWYQLANRRKYDLSAKIPGPKTFPLVGNLFLLINKTPGDILGLFADCKAQFGRSFRIWFGPFNVSFYLCDPKDVEVVLSSNSLLKKNTLYDFILPWLGTGLLISDGRKWHARRKIITPTFHFKILEQFVETFHEKSVKMIAKLKEEVKENQVNVIDVYPFVNTCTLDIIGQTAMGIELNSQNNQNADYVAAVVRMSEIAISRYVQVWPRTDWIFRLFYRKMKREQDDLIHLMHEFTENIIDQRRSKEIEKKKRTGNENNEDVENNEMGIKKKMALLDVLLNSTHDGKPLSNKDIREEVDTFMFEGHDTTTSAICFALYAISKLPQVQKKIYEELQNVMGDGREEGALTIGELGDLKYLELVIKESMRMYPPVPMFGRRTEEEIQINDKIIPRNCNVTVLPCILGMDPEIFPEPDKFIPERFTKENMQDKNAFSYIVFSAGPRNCIGQKFAMLELKSLLSKVINEFELIPSGVEPILSAELILRSKNGFQIGMKRRKL